jgi:hypothetical protein
MFCASFFYLGIASGLSNIKNARWKTFFLILIILISAYSLSNYYTNSEFHNPAYIRPTKECCEEVMKISHLGDVVITHVPELYYLKKSNGRQLFHFDEIGRTKEYIKENENQRVWLIFVSSPLSKEREKARDEFTDWLSQNYTLKYTHEYDPLKGSYHFISPTFQYKEIIQGYERK